MPLFEDVEIRMKIVLIIAHKLYSQVRDTETMIVVASAILNSVNTSLISFRTIMDLKFSIACCNDIKF